MVSFAAALVVAGVAGLINATVGATELVSVATSDGRNLVGSVDARTDGTTLWLRQVEGRVVLSVPVAWDDVATARVEDQPLAPHDLRQRRNELATTGPASLFDEALAPASSFVGNPVSNQGAVHYASPRVRNVDVVAAGLVNLDRDPAPDGLTISVVAVGIDGLPVAVDGNLRAELHGERRSIGDASPRFEVLDRWTQAIRQGDFIDGVATYCLPFRRSSPEWEVDIAPDAEITIRLGAAGHGNFAAAAPVLLREFNPLRDDLQQHRGTRFLPNEPYHRPLGPFGERAGLWQWWAQ